MKMEAWATLFEGLSSYSAIASTYFFARPALRLQGTRATIELLEEAAQHQDDEVAQFARELRQAAHSKLTGSHRRELRWNLSGAALLVFSALSLAVAVGIHAYATNG